MPSRRVRRRRKRAAARERKRVREEAKQHAQDAINAVLAVLELRERIDYFVGRNMKVVISHTTESRGCHGSVLLPTARGVDMRTLWNRYSIREIHQGMRDLMQENETENGKLYDLYDYQISEHDYPTSEPFPLMFQQMNGYTFYGEVFGTDCFYNGLTEDLDRTTRAVAERTKSVLESCGYSINCTPISVRDQARHCGAFFCVHRYGLLDCSKYTT